MSENTRIAWADDTISPWVGCKKTSPACQNCYAEGFARRFFPEAKAWDGKVHRQSAPALARMLGKLERAKQARRVSCGSMTDFGLVAAAEPDGLAGFMSSLYQVQDDRQRAGHPRHAFIILTKRPKALAAFFSALVFCEATRVFQHSPGKVPTGFQPATGTFPGLWVGVTAEDQTSAEARIPILLDMELPELLCVSAEPLLAPIRLDRVREDGGTVLDALRGTRTHRDGTATPTRRVRWVITGGETGHRARPTNPEWVQQVEAQALSARCPFFHKSWGAWGPITADDAGRFLGEKVGWMSNSPSSLIPTREAFHGYPMAAKRGAVKNDAIAPGRQETPRFLDES